MFPGLFVNTGFLLEEHCFLLHESYDSFICELQPKQKTLTFLTGNGSNMVYNIKVVPYPPGLLEKLINLHHIFCRCLLKNC